MGWRLELEEGGQVALSKAASPHYRRHRLTVYGNTTKGPAADVVVYLSDRELARFVNAAAKRLGYLQVSPAEGVPPLDLE